MGHASFTYIRKTGGIANELNLNTLSAQRSLTSEIPERQTLPPTFLPHSIIDTSTRPDHHLLNRPSDAA